MNLCIEEKSITFQLKLLFSRKVPKILIIDIKKTCFKLKSRAIFESLSRYGSGGAAQPVGGVAGGVARREGVEDREGGLPQGGRAGPGRGAGPGGVHSAHAHA